MDMNLSAEVKSTLVLNPSSINDALWDPYKDSFISLSVGFLIYEKGLK